MMRPIHAPIILATASATSSTKAILAEEPTSLAPQSQYPLLGHVGHLSSIIVLFFLKKPSQFPNLTAITHRVTRPALTLNLSLLK